MGLGGEGRAAEFVASVGVFFHCPRLPEPWAGATRAGNRPRAMEGQSLESPGTLATVSIKCSPGWSKRKERRRERGGEERSRCLPSAALEHGGLGGGEGVPDSIPPPAVDISQAFTLTHFQNEVITFLTR